MKYIDGNMLKQMIISGANNLFNHYPEVDALNVFPVPDGDTGTNMNLTISSGAKEIRNRLDTDVYDIAKSFSKGLLMGARGNSGVILSQIFRGFSQALEGASRIDSSLLAEAFVSGKEVAYKAVMRPVEGTILTVIRESSDALQEHVYRNPNIDINKAFEYFLKEAYESLDRTPELLPVLKEVGVVDSGGAGLIKVLEGFQSAINGKVIERNMATVTEEPQQMAAANVEGEEYGYCTEFIMRLPEEPISAGKKVFSEKRFQTFLTSHGNSIVVVRDEELVKVHVHTLNPGNVLVYAQQFGEFVKLKIENMSEQHTQLQEENKDPLKQNEVKELTEYALISVSVGDGIEEMFKDLNVTEIVSGGQTMNPSTEDFIEAIKRCNAKKIFILPNNSNIIMAASQACDVAPDGVECRVIPTKTIPQGLTACMMFNPEASFDDNEEEMKEAMSNVKSGQVTFAIRDTVIDDVEVKKDNFIALFGKKIVSCDPDKIQVTMNMLEEMIDESSSIITLICGEDASEEEVEKLTEMIQDKYDEVDLDVRKGNQPVYSFIVGVE
ncbi:MAG: DAK2 domain-containing protein [Erysipelotrichaceae bacterium]|nr:DAK2 domain-containing protein [Erysipelotrichaceae bacterium]